MATEAREIEMKYEAGPGALLPPLEDLPRVASEAGPDEEKLEAEYYDTEDLRLLRAGVTLRRRRGGADAGWHLKLPAGPDTRREIRIPLGRTGRAVPAELARLVRVYTRGEALTPVARVATVRHKRTLLDEAGTSLAEVVADEVSAQSLGESTTISQWREVEVELTGGDRHLLRAADKRLRNGGLRRAGRMAKLEQALADRLPAGPDGTRPVGRGSSSAEVVLAYLREQAGIMMALDPMVRRNEPDSIHQMRVASRRLRGTFQSFGKIVRGADTRHLRDELRWLSHVLGDARDAEVLSERLGDAVGHTPAELVMGPVAARLREHFSPLEARTRDAVIQALDSERYVRMLNELDRLLADPPLTPLGHRPATEGIPREAARTYKRTARRMRAAQRASGDARDVALHSARRAAKRARYAGEAASPVYGKKARRFAKRMKKIQSTLGTHQDAVIARDVIREIGVRAHLEGENAFTFGLLHERNTVAAREAERRAWKAWKKASRRRNRTWMR
ncbi:MAG TPA: CYTH and CHAD domain-containing protein [Streptosporangiaceae bacterium]|nr:CYTH and CHAD domain-containing protein [Streptosporangiaceae bacterium]